MKKFTLNCKGKLFVAAQPLIMGILNCTPDSFYDGGKFPSIDTLLQQTEKMLQEGADIIDIGAVSSKPNSVQVSAEVEINRIIPIVEAVHRHFPEALISIDTFRSDVAEICIQHGATIINDISGGHADENIMRVAAKYHCPYIMMHRLGDFETMHQQFEYTDVITSVFDYFSAKIETAKKFGINDVIIDVGFSFSKTIPQNYTLLKNLSIFEQLNKPVLVGLSRKSMLYKLLNTNPENALNATTAVNSIALQQGASILRVHDVKEAAECVKIYNQLQAI
ncbi:MAG: dihydropteroate synthase [Chitinophagales bacterium]|nr:dihydropteroate synthase [Chitinophagales bacterium]